MKPLARPAAEGVAHPLVVPHAALAPDPHQPRQSGVGQGLDQLVESIRAHGIIQPILVRPHPDPAARARTPYMIVVGERRWTAAGRAGRDEVPVFLLDQPLSPAGLLMLQIEENEGENRQDLPLQDLVGAVARAFQLEGLSQADFARRHGKSTAWVSYRLVLHRAGGAVAEALREGRLRGILVARTFQRLTPEQQRELLARAKKDGTAISLVATEKLAGRAERRRRGAPQADGDDDATAPPATPSEAAAAAASPPKALASSRAAAAPVAVPDAATTSPGDATSAPASLATPGAAASPQASAPAPSPSKPVSPTATVAPPSGTLVAAPGTQIPVPATRVATTGASMAASGTPGPAPGTTASPGSTPALDSESAAGDDAPSGSQPPPSVLRYRGAPTPTREPAPSSRTPARAAIPDRSLPTGPAQAAPGPPIAALPAIAPRSAAAGLLAAAGPLPAPASASPLDPDHPAAAADPAAARITLDLSLAQLQKLVRLLGLEPAATPRALVHQLMTSL